MCWSARVRIGAKARKKLEMLCRYTARPPISFERLSKTPDGKLLYGLKTKYHDGTSPLLFIIAYRDAGVGGGPWDRLAAV